MPPIGLLLGGIDFSQMAITLKEETAAAESVNINYGVFLSTVLDFIIVAFAIFMVIKQINRFKKKEQPVAEPTTKDARNASPPLLSWRVVAQTVLQSFNPHRFAPWRNNRRFNSRLRCFPFSSWRDLKKILSSLFLSPPFCSPSHTCSCFPPSISGAICAPLAAWYGWILPPSPYPRPPLKNPGGREPCAIMSIKSHLNSFHGLAVHFHALKWRWKVRPRAEISTWRWIIATFWI